jgi:hypothetical protein
VAQAVGGVGVWHKPWLDVAAADGACVLEQIVSNKNILKCDKANLRLKFLLKKSSPRYV